MRITGDERHVSTKFLLALTLTHFLKHGLLLQKLLVLLHEQLPHEVLMLGEGHASLFNLFLRLLLPREVSEELDGAVWLSEAQGPLRLISVRPNITLRLVPVARSEAKR